MKRVINILIIIVIYLVFCGKSCEEEGEKNRRQSHEASLVKDSIRHDFATDILTEEARYAAGLNAMQKLKDLADYIEIYSNRSLEPPFREKAGEMIKKMFFYHNNRLLLGQARKEKLIKITLEDFLKNGFVDDFIRVKLNFDSVRVIEPLVISNDGNYSGKISASQSFIGYTANDSLLFPVKPVIIDFFSSSQAKLFGSDTLIVRVVSLGDFSPEE